MLRRCLPESRPPAQHPCVVPQRDCTLIPKRFWWPVVGAALLCVLRLTWTAPGYAAAESPGFANNCSGFAQDPLFGPLWPGTSEQKGGRRSTALAAMVPRLSLHGTALATYEPQKVRQTAPTRKHAKRDRISWPPRHLDRERQRVRPPGRALLSRGIGRGGRSKPVTYGSRPLPARPADEAVRGLEWRCSFPFDPCRLARQVKQFGRLPVRPSHANSFTCRTSRQGSG